ncbi:3-phosphoshikimate 1-carboxyvinyltransferase [Sporobacter termitidis DSM 10068]|uniref:3-phosphoshikimate 1-carboxyvinyltransferase n=1 Tax=Sporobacter termitidis DSM 10068 TaxID=1123282 RepID=A0A1M5X275_9FIRM|nr:3-phosphoshikimate 1-carboxyvinyltransferase [Sporobacter termitidis]SHH93840.1 3-phosphoshikimate 1-carboxyvinyltransferase [Sporobacter termitidis DSM 10068]
MTVTITKPITGGAVGAIASKSMAHRLLICAALASAPSSVVCAETSADIDATAGCLTALGARIDFDGGVFRVVPIPRPVAGERTLAVGESGSTLRFMLPVACALGADASLTMAGRLPSRPLSPLYEELISHGCAISAPGYNPLRTSGQLTGGKYTIPGNISSQFISGLMFALPLLHGESRIKILGDIESKPYIDMTLAALKEFGVTVKPGRQMYGIAGNQQYASGRTVTVEGDWSNAAFWLCAGAVGSGEITVTGLSTDSLQGDKGVVDILERFGARVRRGGGSVTVSRGALKGIDIDAGDTPDLVPALAAVAAAAEGTTVFRNAGRLRIKESDRLKTVTETLAALGADIAETEDGLVVRGKPRLGGGTVSAHGDHRIAMAAAVVSSVCAGPVTIAGAEAVNKSYPGFFSDFTILGGNYKETT